MTDHPAKFSDDLLKEIGLTLHMTVGLEHGLKEAKVLDPFAGTGKIHGLSRWFDTYGIEIEPKWAELHERTQVGDATDLPFEDEFFDAVATSPTYGNRMADNYAGDGTKRHTYRISLGEPLQANNSGGMQWGEKYRDLHRKAWGEAWRVTRPGGWLVINVKDHIRQGSVIPVSAWHTLTACEMGWTWIQAKRVQTPGIRHGANADLRLDHEWIITFQKT